MGDTIEQIIKDDTIDQIKNDLIVSLSNIIVITDSDGDYEYVFVSEREFQTRSTLYKNFMRLMLFPDETAIESIIQTNTGPNGTIGNVLLNLFRAPSVGLISSFRGGGNNFPIISKYGLEMIIYLIENLKVVVDTDSFKRLSESLVSGLDVFDSAGSLIKSTLRQIVCWTKHHKPLHEILSLCIYIQNEIDEVKRDKTPCVVSRFCANSLLRLWIDAKSGKEDEVDDDIYKEVCLNDYFHWELAVERNTKITEGSRKPIRLRLEYLKKNKKYTKLLQPIDYDRSLDILIIPSIPSNTKTKELLDLLKQKKIPDQKPVCPYYPRCYRSFNSMDKNGKLHRINYNHPKHGGIIRNKLGYPYSTHRRPRYSTHHRTRTRRRTTRRRRC